MQVFFNSFMVRWWQDTVITIILKGYIYLRI